jgi:histidinol dehydrogenase
LGPNAVLPTTGYARTYSALSVRDFVKTSSISYLTKAGYDDLRAHVINFAEYEGFAAHALSLQERKFRPASEACADAMIPPTDSRT